MGDITYAAGELGLQKAPHILAPASYTDPATGAVYVHKDLELTVLPWAVEEHIPPINRTEQLGDVESWVSYVKTFADFSDHGEPPKLEDWSLLTWNERGLSAVLDYHLPDGTPNRCQWRVSHAFVFSLQWQAWRALADGRPRGQRELLERVEDLAEDIVSPPPAELAGILRQLRATSTAEATAELKADGSTDVSWRKNQTVQAGGATLPPEFVIEVPVLKGHTATNDEGRAVAVVYRLPVRLRVSVDDGAKLAFRLSLPTAERVLELAIGDRVAEAKRLLGDGYALLRAAV